MDLRWGSNSSSTCHHGVPAILPLDSDDNTMVWESSTDANPKSVRQALCSSVMRILILYLVMMSALVSAVKSIPCYSHPLDHHELCSGLTYAGTQAPGQYQGSISSYCHLTSSEMAYMTHQFYTVHIQNLLQKSHYVAILRPWWDQADPQMIFVKMKYTIKWQNIEMWKLLPSYSPGRNFLTDLLQVSVIWAEIIVVPSKAYPHLTSHIPAEYWLQ
jgi:hypothetical protein